MGNEIKAGSRHNSNDQKLIQQIHDHALELGAASPQSEPLAGFVSVKDDAVIAYGDELKALGDGKIAGYLVRFSSEDDPDLAGDYFTKDTDFGEVGDAEHPMKLPLLYHHGLDPKIGKRRIGTANITTDDVGLWLEGQLNLRDAYEKAIYQMVEKKKQGLSSGATGHAVTRVVGQKAAHITQWYIGEASITPTPAEPRNEVVSLKSIGETNLLIDGSEISSEALPEAEPEAGNGGDAAITDETKTTGSAVKTAEVTEMTPEEKQELIDAIKASSAEATALAIKTNKEQIDAAIAALKNEAPTTPEGGVKTAPAHLKTGRGDDAFKAFTHFIKTGDAGGIHTGDAYENYMKTDYHLVEGTQYQGQEAVPTEVYAGIVKKRNTLSFARMGGAQVYPANSNALNIPVEKAQPQNWTITAADAVTASATLTQQPLDKLAATLYVFTYNLPYHYTLIDDATFNVEGWGTDYVARGLARTENAYFSMGTGSGQPQGAVYGSTLGVTAASATAVTAAEVAALLYKLDAAYQDNVIWAMLTATHGTVRALANPSNGFAFIGNGGYSGGAGTGSAEPNAGWLVDPRTRVFTPNGMDSLAASKKPIFAGNLNAGYAIVERMGLTVLRDPYSEASQGNVNVWFRSRFSGGVVNADALQHIATPSA